MMCAHVFAEALTLAGQVQNLATTVESTLNTIVSKKSVFAKELLAPGILLNLKLEKAATDRFSAATVSVFLFSIFFFHINCSALASLFLAGGERRRSGVIYSQLAKRTSSRLGDTWNRG